MKVKIYLNDGEDHFFGFGHLNRMGPDKAELVMVHSFELTETEHAWVSPITETSIKQILEYVFEHTNLRTEPLGRAFQQKMLRSVSVGDVVVVGETAWACESVGWTLITTEQLTDAIIWDDEKNAAI